MGNIIDLRKHNIKTEEDVMEFLELFVTKAPQIVKVLKDQKLKTISLRNRLDHALNNPAQQAPEPVLDPNASVLDRMTGKNKAPVLSPAQTRLGQLKAAQQTSPANAAPAAKPETSVDDLPPAPVAPGEIGQLNVPAVNLQAPDIAADANERAHTEAAASAGAPTPDSDFDDPNFSSATLEGAPTDAIISTPDESSGSLGATDGVSEEDVAQAAGSKSERPADDDLQPEDTSEELSDEEKAALQAPSTQASEADKTPLGAKLAKKDPMKHNKKKK